MKKSKLILSIIVLFISICTYTKVYGGVNISQTSVEVNIEESKTVTLSASNATGTVYTSSSNSSIAIVSSENWIEDGKSINITITGKSAGSATITVNGIVSDNAGNDAPYSKTINVTVRGSNQGGTTTQPPEEKPNQGGTTTNPPVTPKPTEKSTVATLSDLGILPNDFKGFKSNTYSYSVEVPNEVEKIEIYAKPAKGQEGKQKISGHGANKILKVGSNKFEINVTAEDGKTTKKYTIDVIRKAKEDDQTPPITEEPPEEQPTDEQPIEEGFGLTELKIEGITLSPEFQTDKYEYKIDLKEDISKLNITTIATHPDTVVEVLGNENLIEGENIITIIVKPISEEDAMEKKNATYQIIVNKSIIENTNTLNEIAGITTKEPNWEQNNTIKIIIVVVSVVILLAIISAVVIINIKKNRKYITFDEMEEQEEINGDEEFLEENNNDEKHYEESSEDYYEDEVLEKRKPSKGKRFK